MMGKLNSGKTAVIIIDVQNDYIHENGILSRFLGTKNLQRKIPSMVKFVSSLRDKKAEIIHIQMTEGKDSIDSNLKEKRIQEFGSPENWELAVPGTWGYELMLDVKEGEKIFKKNSYDVFSNPELEKYLKEKGIDTLIVFGGYTHVCVDSSIRSAVTRGFKVILAENLVGSPDKFSNLHENSLKVLKSLFAYGMQSEKIIELF